MLTSDQKIKINEKVQGFKEAADFYRMEYSQDLMGMFREFGCMLLEACGINAEDDLEIKQLFAGAKRYGKAPAYSYSRRAGRFVESSGFR